MTLDPPAVRSPRHGPGRWVWSEGEPRPYHQYLLVRRAFGLTGEIRSARLDITASDRYAVWLNGRYLGRGPARSDPRRKRYDSYEVDPGWLLDGRNVLAVRAYCYGSESAPSYRPPYRGNGYTVGERAGLWAELATDTSAGRVIVGTDESWKMRRALSWDRTAGLINGWVGSIEVYDARLDDPAWTMPDFDDELWEPAWRVPNRQHPWVLLVPRTTPHLIERAIRPRSLLAVTEVTDIGHLADQSPPVLELPEILRQQIHLPLTHAKAVGTASLVGTRHGTVRLRAVLAGPLGIRCPVLLFDFGRQVFGFPRLELTAAEGAIVDMNYGQQLIDGRIAPGVRYGDRYVAREGRQEWQVGDYRQFRYLELAVRDPYATTSVHSVSVTSYEYPTVRRGSFEASDDRLSQLWEAAVITTELHMEDTIICDAQRERVAWSTGDGSHAVHGIYAAFGDLPLIDHWLRDWPLTDRGDGMLKVSYPPDETNEYNVPIFMMQWGTRVKESWLMSGRLQLVQELYPSVCRQMDWYEPHLDADGLLRELPYANWLDWTPVDLRGANLGTNAFYVIGLEDAALVAEAVGAATDAARWRALANRVRDAAGKAFWSDERGLFLDSHLDGRATGSASELGNALALTAGLAETHQRELLVRTLEEQPHEIIQVSPLYVGYVMDALLDAGAGAHALRIAAERFAPMLAGSHPTLWEGWSPYTGALPIVGEGDVDTLSRLRPVSYRSLPYLSG